VLPLPKVARREVAVINALASWLGASGAIGRRTAALVGGPVTARGIAPATSAAFAARCELRVRGVSIEVRGGNAGVRAIAQRVLGGPNELAAPRPLGAVEHAIWALAVAAAVEDLAIAGEVFACEAPVVVDDPIALAIDVELAGSPFTVELVMPRSLQLRATPPRVPAWAERAVVAGCVVLGRCTIDRMLVTKLAIRSVITLDRTCELVLLGGSLGLRAIPPGEVVAEVATGYVGRSMSLPDDSRVELTVGLSTTQSLRQVLELSVGHVVALGRPLAGPFEIRAAGNLVGKGELVDVDGELGVRIVSLGEQE
jgi:flagellar motor switch/type III secretory pathway protein FliN